MSFRRILCSIDFSDCSRAAMRHAVELAVESRAALTLLHVWQPPVYPCAGEVPTIPDDIVQELRIEAGRTLEKWAQEAHVHGADRLSTSLLEGFAWDQIIAVLRNDPAYDLAVLGTHGRTGLKHVLLGSVAEKVVRHAPCPVLVARERE
jgi:nucleotide-binding universal stress UspA family protein